MALSDQLTDLAARTRDLEEAAAATRGKNRVKLEDQREKLHSKIKTEAQSIQSTAGKAETGARSWLTDTTTRFEQKRADLRAKMDEHRAERKVEQAERNADAAEDYAADMVSWAAYAIDTAEYAVVDAAISRTTADELVASRK